MMKGTASIHLHVNIRNSKELPLLYATLKDMACSEDFRMGKDRRDIWDKTDPCRCGLPFKNIESSQDSVTIINEFVRLALKADDISENKPFCLIKDTSENSFLYHLTTIFTDIRLNLKGPTLELRTLDSLPAHELRDRWKKFSFALR